MVRREVTRSSYGDTLYYGLSMFAEFEKLPYPSVTSISVNVERVTTHYKTLQTWIGHNATHYHNFNALPHALPYISLISTRVGYDATRYHNFNALPHVLPYIFSDICLILGYLQWVTTRYRQFILKNINIHFFYKFDGNTR